MPRRKRQRGRKRRCIYCGHEEPAHFVTCRNFIKMPFTATKPALSLIVDNTKDETNAQD